MLNAIIGWHSGGTDMAPKPLSIRPSRRNHAKVSADDPASCTNLFFRGIMVFPLGGQSAAGPKSVSYAKNEQICRYIVLCGEPSALDL
jgi:hypothetical protein